MNQGIVFLDRDGTINIDTGYITDPNKIVLFDGIATAIGNLKRANFAVVIVTNQSAIGRGMAGEADVIATNDAVCRILLEQDADAYVDQVLFSPDPPGNNSSTRKPQTGLLDELSSDLVFEPSHSWLCGDKLTDVQFGLNAGLPVDQCLLLLTGAGKEELAKLTVEEQRQLPSFNSLVEAVEHLLSRD